MILFEALSSSDCPICLQPLAFDRSASGSSSQPSGDPRRAASPARSLHDDINTVLLPADAGAGASSPLYSLSVGESCLVVLACGHFLHASCLAQLWSYSGGKDGAHCPVCRRKIQSLWHDVIQFSPRTRPPRLARALTGPGAEADGEPRCETGRPLAAERGSSGESVRSDVAVANFAEPAADATRSGTLTGGSPSRKRGRTISGPGQDGGDTTQGSLMAPHSDCLSRPVRSPCKDDGDGRARPARAPRRLPRAPAGDSGGVEQPRVETMVLSDESSHSSDDIELVATRQVPLPEVYRDLLDRSSALMKERGETLADRHTHLRASQQQLREDCEELNRSAAALRQQCDIIGDGGSATSGQTAEQRRQELVRVCAETKASCDAVTAELAAAVRESSAVGRQLDSYMRKIERRQKEKAETPRRA